MTTKTILTSVTIAAITVMLTMSALPAMAQPAYTTVEGFSIDQNGNSLNLSVDTAGDIPRFADAFVLANLVFGFAWADLDTGEVVLATLHPTIGRDSNQNPDAWHTHPGTLSGATTNSDFCVETLGVSQGGLSIQGDVMNLNIPASQAGVSAAALDGAVAFIVQADAECLTTGLGVDAFNFGIGL